MAKTTKAAEGAPADRLFAPVVEAFARDPEITEGRMFGSPGLKIGSKVFAMLVKGALVVKLPRARVDALVASGTGAYFDPGHGRLMKEWVAVGPSARSMWLGLAKEAKDFVVAIPFTEAQVCSPRFLSDYVDACRTASPLIEFLTRAIGLPW